MVFTSMQRLSAAAMLSPHGRCLLIAAAAAVLEHCSASLAQEPAGFLDLRRLAARQGAGGKSLPDHLPA